MWERVNADEREVGAGRRELRCKEGNKIQGTGWISGQGADVGDATPTGRKTDRS